MVAVKERPRNAASKAIHDQKMSRTGQVKKFKIFVESDKVKGSGAAIKVNKEKPQLRKSDTTLLDADVSKSNLSQSDNGQKRQVCNVKVSVGRKVLADVGNVKRSVLESRKGKGSWVLHEGDVCLVNIEASTSIQPSEMKQASMKAANLIQNSDENQISKNSFIVKNIKATSRGPQTTKLSNHKPETSRKSLPILKQASRVETSARTKPEYSFKSDSGRGKLGFPVKPNSGKSIVHKPISMSSRPWGNRVSDGFVLMPSRAQTKTEFGDLSRKYVKPAVKTKVIARNTKRNCSNSSITMKNLKSIPDDLLKVKQEPEPEQEKASELKSIPPAAPKGALDKEEDVSSVNLPQKKSDRRNSFTSSLIMSRSKLLKECKSATPLKTLPQIYDENNHLDVFEYVDDIYRYYWVMEGQNPSLRNYMEAQSNITPQMRGLLINWIIEVHLKFDLMEETLFLTISLLDRYLSLENIKKNEIQLVGLTAFLLASKYEDFWHPRVSDLISISAEPYTRDQILKMEKTMLSKLKFRLNEPTPYVFMLRFLKAVQSKTKKFDYLAFYLLELCLVEYEALNYKPSMLCASAIYVARCTMHMTPLWTPLLVKHTRYDESQLRECSEMVLNIHKGAKTSPLRVSYEKYMSCDFGRVAEMKALVRLPVL